METGNTGYVDYGAGAAGPHMRYHGLDEEEGPKEVRIHLMFCFLKTVPVSVRFGSLILLFPRHEGDTSYLPHVLDGTQ